jgi:signal transduction histidine kinase
MRFTIGHKLVAVMLGVVICGSFGAYRFASEREQQKLLFEKQESAALTSRLIAVAVAPSLFFDDVDGVKDALALASANPAILAAGIWKGGAGGRVLTADRRADPKQQLSSPDAAEDPDPWGSGFVTRQAPVVGADGAEIGLALVVASLAPERAAFGVLQRQILMTSVGAGLVLALLLAVVSQLVVVGPIVRLREAAIALAKGQRSALDTRGTDEVADLSRSFVEMAAAIREREESLGKRNQEMRLVLNNVGQGLLVIDRDARVGPERSAVVDTWFGPPDADSTFIDLLARMDGLVSAGFAAAWDQVISDFFPLEVALAQLPSRLRTDRAMYDISYRPILDSSEAMSSVLVVITDITSIVAHESERAEQSDILEAATQLIKDREAFLTWMADARVLVAQIIDAETEKPLRQLHTLKGNAAVFGLSGLASRTNALEEVLADGRALTAQDKTDLAQGLERLLDRVSALLTTPSAGSSVVADDMYNALVDQVKAGASQKAILQTLESWKFEPTEKALTRLSEYAKKVSEQLGKKIEVDVVSNGLRLPQRYDSIWSTMTHLVRNAVDHGIESPETRVARGKGGSGTLRLETRKADEGVYIVVSDDGGGIEWERVRTKAHSIGIASESQVDLENALFNDGFSTRDVASEISGRGVGLSALKDEVVKMGGVIQISSSIGKGAEFACFVPNEYVASEQTRSAA